MKNKGLIFLLSIALASCGSNEHKPVNGSVDSIIPLPQEMVISKNESGEAEAGLYCDGSLVVAGTESVGESWSVISGWLENAGVNIHVTDAIRPNLVFSIV